MNLVWREESFAALSNPGECRFEPYPAAARISQHRFSAVLLLADIIIVLLTGLIPAVVYFGLQAASLDLYLAVVSAGLLLFLLITRTLNVYRTHRIFEWRRALSRSLTAVVFTFFGLMLAGVALKTTESYSRVWFFSWFAMSALSVVALRVLLLAVVEAKLAKGSCLQRALIVALNPLPFTGEQLALESRNRMRAVGMIVAPNVETLPDLAPYIQQLQPEVIILHMGWPQVAAAMNRIPALSNHAVEVLVLPQANYVEHSIMRLRQLGTQTFLQIAAPPLVGWGRAAKRIEDVVVASIALVVASPVLLLTALAIKLDSRGPVLFKQMRAGFNNDLIEVWKFRSMHVEGTDLHASRQTSKDDPRVTRVGRFIRRTSLDELPQFWNVIQGSMSVVGPRPHALATQAGGQSLDAIVDAYAARHRVKPGITGWAQINGARGELQTREQVQKRVDYDLHYIENWSLIFDLKIILMTVVRVFYDPRAY
jgi:polysaccharide biosynthesis protein PslA